MRTSGSRRRAGACRPFERSNDWRNLHPAPHPPVTRRAAAAPPVRGGAHEVGPHPERGPVEMGKGPVTRKVFQSARRPSADPGRGVHANTAAPVVPLQPTPACRGLGVRGRARPGGCAGMAVRHGTAGLTHGAPDPRERRLASEGGRPGMDPGDPFAALHRAGRHALSASCATPCQSSRAERERRFSGSAEPSGPDAASPGRAGGRPGRGAASAWAAGCRADPSARCCWRTAAGRP